MDAAIFNIPSFASAPSRSTAGQERFVDAIQFRELLISHRRLVRADRRAEQLRGLKDLDTGEVFLTDEQRLINLPR